MDDRTKQLLALGREHYEKREFEKAEHYLAQLVDRGINFADVYNMLGVIRHDQGRFDEAQAAFEHALELNPRYTEASLNLAVTYNDLGRYADATKIYQSAMSGEGREVGELDPFVRGKIANLHAEVGAAYADFGLYEESIAEYRKAIDLCPTFADLSMRMAKVMQQKGDLDDARHALEAALEHKPHYAPARVSLGVILMAQGEVEAAKQEWEKALESDPGHKSAQMYLRMSRGAPAASEE